MIEYVIRMTEAAEADLEDLAKYIAVELQEPRTALNQFGRIKAAIMALQEMPERHNPVADAQLAAQGLRKIPVDDYLVFYVVDRRKQVVNIVRILHGRREWENIL